MLARTESAISAETTEFMTFLHLWADADDTMSPPIDREEHGFVGVIRA